ncbi:ArpU family phage packaging/lysis transcriptional regulator [Enterococcus gallinarum]|uniref:ArpU family phage packaging/lysis transcriptional regulator n=1 Tax=Enterococcus gallinarum TaxID=1353 RepID=A0AAE4HSB6_ENTGA|nr:ArpU family phage packaging/lysis transcriptional regulator [Enterococcus gallinarum]MDT2691993.1 ArpU family phage packaging/lysis transcriptional regulator [Enterococcus gallinarum]
MVVIKEADIKQTKANAKDILKQYRGLERKAGRSPIDIRSPFLNDMPKAPKYENRVEDAMIQSIEIKEKIQAIEYALSRLGLMSKQVLYYTYCVRDVMTNDEIADNLGVATRTLNRMKSEALLEFADVFGIVAYR